MANIFNITKENALLIISESKKGVDQRIIAGRVGCSQATISRFIRAYNGNTKEYDLLSTGSKKLIQELKNEQLITIEYPTYECSLFFGLFKIKLKPIKN
jgi:predicted transcriptional regulator